MGWRNHLALANDAPHARRIQATAEDEVAEIREVGGLHHHDERRAGKPKSRSDARLRVNFLPVQIPNFLDDIGSRLAPAFGPGD